jgi:hypothetical protein
MFPYSLGVLTLLQGLYSLLWIAILLDWGSPTLDLRLLPDMTTAHVIGVTVVMITISFPVGVMMHTLSRNLFRKQKDQWAMDVLLSPAVIRRFEGLNFQPPGGVATLEEIQQADGFAKIRKAGQFMHTIHYEIMQRAPQLYRTIQVYRDQYQLARGFILSSVVLAIVLPFWGPIITLEAGYIGPFPLIGFQLFLLSLLFACVSFLAFRERSYRYIAAQLMGFMTLESRPN